MHTHFETRHAAQERKPGKTRRDDRRAAIARKQGFMIEVLNVRN